MSQERLDALFDAWSESRLTREEATELSALLRSDSAARARFRAAANFQGELHAALDGLNLDQASTPDKKIAVTAQRSAMGLAAMLLAVGLTAASVGWILSARAELAEVRPLGIRDGGFDALKGRVPDGFPHEIFTWGGDPSEITAAPGHPTALRFLEAAGEPNIPNSPSQSCDIFQIVDLRSVRGRLMGAAEAYVELQASLLDARGDTSTPIRFISKVYVFEGSPHEIAKNWPPAADQVLASGAQFHVSRGGRPEEWKTLTTRCVLPPTAGFLVVHIGAGSASRNGTPSPRLGAQFADDIRLTLHTRQNKAELAAR